MSAAEHTYSERLTRRCEERDRWHRQFILIGNARLLVFLAAVGLAWLAWRWQLLSGWWLVAPGLIFGGLIIWHERVAVKRRTAERAIQYYRVGLARLNDEWRGEHKHDTAHQIAPASHVYADDLDLFGSDGLFAFLSTARTRIGEETLTGWLLGPAKPGEARDRQQAAEELSHRLDLREEIAALGAVLRSEISLAGTERWVAAPPLLLGPGLRAALVGLSVVALVTAGALIAKRLPAWPALLSLAANQVAAFAVRKRVRAVVAAAGMPGGDLRLLADVLGRLERERFEAKLLGELRACWQTAGASASRRLTVLQRWMDLLDSQDHVLLRILQPFTLLREHTAFAIEQWRVTNGAAVHQWLAAVGEMEALLSLATLRFERPHWAFPTLAEDEDACFEARQLRHPLLAESRAVANDVLLGNGTRLWIVSGSNMSGKSTLLRAVGLATVLAWAGAPVPAAALTLSRLQVGASIRVVDSLAEGHSRFLAEVLRLKEIVALTQGGARVLFLLDEILSGTNSHDRRIGAGAVVKRLLATRAVGMITTHDLALAELAGELEGAACNVHFDDQIVNGEMRFDYRVKPGRVTRSNALALMRAVGLEV